MDVFVFAEMNDGGPLAVIPRAILNCVSCAKFTCLVRTTSTLLAFDFFFRRSLNETGSADTPPSKATAAAATAAAAAATAGKGATAGRGTGTARRARRTTLRAKPRASSATSPSQMASLTLLRDRAPPSRATARPRTGPHRAAAAVWLTVPFSSVDLLRRTKNSKFHYRLRRQPARRRLGLRRVRRPQLRLPAGLLQVQCA